MGFLCWCQGKRLVFVTNNSTKSRKQYGKKFETLGLDVSEVSKSRPFFFSSLLFCFSNFFISIPLFQEEIFASSFAAAAYLKSIDFPKDKKVFFFCTNFLEWGFVIIVWLQLWRLRDVMVGSGLITGHDFRFMWLARMASWRNLSLLDFSILVGQYVWVFQFALYFTSSSIHGLKYSIFRWQYDTRNCHEWFDIVQRSMAFTRNNLCFC